MKLTYRSTMLACYNGYITQAICINLAPLFYVIFQRNYGLTLGQIGGLIAFNFLTQLSIDFLASFFSGKLNLRFCAVFAHAMTVVGLIGLSVFPSLMPSYFGLIVAECCLGIGGGFTEVMISPLLEACPTDHKSGNMSFLHSFYCWGQAGVVMVSGIYFHFFTPETSWQLLPCVWALIPLLGAIAFCFVPIYYLPDPPPEKKKGGNLFHDPLFWGFLLMMFCAGASEMIMSQWASGFAETALGIPKTVGDLAGPCLFAVMMGTARALYGKFSERIALAPLMSVCCVLCIASYLLAAFVSVPFFALLGCALCGLSVGIFWPATLSRASASLRGAGLAMFALMAVAGDIGCLAGPSLSGAVADLFGGELRYAFCFAVIFPLLNLIILQLQKRNRKGDRE